MKLQKGFTLIELIIVSVIGMVVLASVLRIAGGLNTTEHISRKLNEIHLEKDNILITLDHEIRWADEVKVTGGNNIHINKGADMVQYKLEGDKLIRQQGPDKREINSDKVIIESFEVNDYSAITDYALVDIKFTLSHINTEPTKVTVDVDTSIAQRKSE